jgi:hypothetical protein
VRRLERSGGYFLLKKTFEDEDFCENISVIEVPVLIPLILMHYREETRPKTGKKNQNQKKKKS